MLTMDKSKVIGIVTGVGIVALMVVAIVLIAMGTPVTHTIPFGYTTIIEMADSTKTYEGIDPDSIVATSDVTGNLPEKITGSPDAKVIIYEYADYACSHCAEMNTYVKKLVDTYDGDVAVVFRGFLLNGYPNNVEAAAATNAAAIQGYWENTKTSSFPSKPHGFI